MKYEVRLSNRAQRDLDRVDRPTQKRVVERLELLADDPYNPRVLGWLEGHPGLRKSRLGGWRIIYQTLDDKAGRYRGDVRTARPGL